MNAEARWPASEVILRPIEELRPNASNPRTHSARQIEQIAASIRQWGFTMPLLCDEDGALIAGHGRLEAARVVGLARVPTMIARGWTPAQKRAYMIADNQLALSASWDDPLLASEMQALVDDAFDMNLLGFTDAQLSQLTAPPGRADEDDTPEPPETAITQPGQLVKLGEHRVYCGDATRAEDVEHALGGDAPHLMVTDPPYGVEYDATWRDEEWHADRALGAVSNDDRRDWRDAFALFPGDVAYIWHAAQFAAQSTLSLEAVGFEIRCEIIWAKTAYAISRGHYHWQHEPCWYAVRKGHTAHWQGDRSQTTLWQIDHRKSETGHSTQKPVEAMRRPILNHSLPGERVYDPFGGSGTTLIACELTGRVCRMLEIDPRYCDVIVQRWEQLTGKAAIRCAPSVPA